MAAKRKAVDRERLELDFRAGIKTFREMATDHEISAPRVKQIADEEGWTRDLKKRIQAAATDKLNKSILNTKLNAGRKKASEKQVVDEISDQVAAVQISHRGDMGRSRKLFQALLSELEIETANLELFTSLGELLDTSGPDATGTWRKDKLNEIYQKVISSTGRIDGAKKLVEMLEKLVKMERQAYGITDGDEGKGGIEDFLASIRRKADEGAS